MSKEVNVIKVWMDSENSYFKLGLEFLLKHGFSHKFDLVYLDENDDYTSADLIFKKIKISPECNLRKKSISAMVVYYLDEHDDGSQIFLESCTILDKFILPKYSLEKIMMILIECFNNSKKIVKLPCEKCKHPFLSVNEKKVTSLIRLGYSNFLISEIMKITTKSVSRNKRNVMKKYNLKNNISFYNFITEIKKERN